MPSVSEKQARTMAAIAHGWKPDHGDVADIPVGVAKDFNEADQGKRQRRSRLAKAMMKTEGMK